MSKKLEEFKHLTKSENFVEQTGEVLKLFIEALTGSPVAIAEVVGRISTIPFFLPNALFLNKFFILSI